MYSSDKKWIVAVVAAVLLIIVMILAVLGYAAGVFPIEDPGAEPSASAEPTPPSAAQLLAKTVCAQEAYTDQYRVIEEDHAEDHKVLLNTSDTDWATPAGYWKEPGTDRWVPVDTTATTIPTDQRITTNTPAHTTALTCEGQ